MTFVCVPFAVLVNPRTRPGAAELPPTSLDVGHMSQATIAPAGNNERDNNSVFDKAQAAYRRNAP